MQSIADRFYVGGVFWFPEYLLKDMRFTGIEEVIREKQALEIPENSLPLSIV